MAILATGLPVNTASSLPQAAPAATASVALLPGQVPSVARLITPQAVSAPAAAQAFSPGTTQPQRPVVRTVANPAASPLAAQFIAQDATTSSEVLAIFNPPLPPAPAPENAARTLINDLRQARGDAPPATNREAPAAPAVALTNPFTAGEAAAQPILINTAALGAAVAPSPSALLSPPPRVNNVVRKPGLVDSSGPEAYRLAVDRNAGPSTNLFVIG